MSEPTGTNPAPDAPNPAMVVARRRAASINLRAQGDEGMGAMMDPANQSLADALKITYRLLQLGMVALVLIFLFSGFQSIKNYESGVRLTFGRVDATDLEPGFKFSWPRPLGEIIRVPTGNESITLAREFFPNLPPDQVNKTVQELANSGRPDLKPEQDGYLVTRDVSVAHARLTAVWRRTGTRAYVENIRTEDEQKLVQSAVMRGAVHAAAQLSLDEFRTGQPDPDRTAGMPAVADVIRDRANRTLADMNSGIEIQSITIEERTPPLSLITEFAKVAGDAEKAKTEVQNARREAIERLSGVAGEATEVLLERIASYDAALAAQDTAKAETILTTIDSILDGQDVTIDGKKFTGRATGRAGQVMSEALQYRSSIVSRAQGEAQTFASKLEAFGSNPSVLLVNDWTDAYRTLLGRREVEVWLLPPGVSTMQLLLNRDPEVVRAREKWNFDRDKNNLERTRGEELRQRDLQKYKDTTAPADTR